MRIILIEASKEQERFARFSHVGTWTKGELCKKCGQPTSRLVEPLLVEWEPDTATVGDLAWCSYTALIADHAAEKLIEAGFEIRLGSVDYVPPSTKSRKARVAFPYLGPSLHWLLPVRFLRADEARSGIELLIDCASCLQKKYSFKRSGIAISRQEWNGEKIFRIQQFVRSSATFMTEAGVETLERHSISNYSLTEAGSIE